MSAAHCAKTRKTAGADEKTPSLAQYFSWINNTNEGSTESQTLINLEYFEYLKREYGMQLDIYALDVGNLDGASGTYEGAQSEKLRKQYPDGYGAIGAKAGELNTKLGIWCGPDGFGNTPESEKARYELMVSLCRDHNFGLFKMDAVCGELRREKTDVFIKMMTECRKYRPGLILLNHRLNLYRAEPYATTFLWGGVETYTDVHICNENTALHHRAYAFTRGNVPGLKRLTEDHGVCISSCPDYFEDELIMQAFGRCLILAPEIYANPWFLRDEEQAHLARIYNLHRQYRNILVDGILLNEKKYGKNAVSRGNAQRRFLVMCNNSWERKTVSISLSREIGLQKCNNVFVAQRFPFEEVTGVFPYGGTCEVTVEPFRACLCEVCDETVKPAMLTGCAYEIVHEKPDGAPSDVNIVASGGKITLPDGEEVSTQAFDNRNREPRLLASAVDTELTDAREKLETVWFAVDSDSLEARCVKRSGETRIPEVRAAREAFFSQDSYVLRGPENRFAFDGDDSTFFDGMSKIAFGGSRVKGGCLRVDFGSVFEADGVMIEYFDPAEPDNKTVTSQHLALTGEYAEKLSGFNKTGRVKKTVVKKDEVLSGLVESVHSITEYCGARTQAYYAVGARLRYFALPAPPDRIYKIALIKDGAEIMPDSPFANNVMPAYGESPAFRQQTAEFTIEAQDIREGCYLSAACNGRHQDEGVYAVLECDGKYTAPSDRAPSYRSNTFECLVRSCSGGYTYYFPMEKEFGGKPLKMHFIYTTKTCGLCDAKVYLCDGNEPKKGKVMYL